MEIKFSKRDFWLAVLAGELVAWLSLPTLENLKVFNILIGFNINFTSFIIFWAIFVPIGAVLGLGAFYLISRLKQHIGFFQLGKYGVIGSLNTLMSAGIYNFMIYITNIASGLYIDLFAVIAFIITVINSFFWNKYWAFDENKSKTFKEEAVKFFVVSSLVALVNTGIIHITVNVIGAPTSVDPKIWANVGLVFAIVVAFVGNFFGYKFIVFKK